MLQSFEEQSGDGIAGLDLLCRRDGYDAEFRGDGRRFLAPLRGFVLRSCQPTAYAVGCILWPLRGCTLLCGRLSTHWRLQEDPPVAISGQGAGRGFRRERRR